MTLFCPNCVPDYLNGFHERPPVLEGERRDCPYCGMGYDPRDRDDAIHNFSHVRGNLDHLADWMAVFIAAEGPRAILKAYEMSEAWKAMGDHRRAEDLSHTVALACMALTCDWHDLDRIRAEVTA